MFLSSKPISNEYIIDNVNNIKIKGTPPIIILDLSMDIRGWFCIIHAQWLSIHSLRAENIMVSSLGNDIGGSLDEIEWAFKQEIKEMISRTSGKIIFEACSHSTLVMGKWEGLKKYVEIVQVTMEVSISKVENIDYKVENTEVNVDNVVVLVLKKNI